MKTRGWSSSIERAYADLNRVNKIKSDFIAIASHELRTPLGVILGYASFLKEDFTGEAGELADAVLSSALQMRGLIEGMTNLRYVQIEESELEMALVDVAELVDAAYADAVALAGAKDQVFEKSPVETGMLVRVDRAKALLALSNLLNNAIKFTPTGGAILLSAERRSREVWLAVRDNGFGIPPDQLERIFEQFYQVEDPMTRHHGGLGLGLAIARAIVERHGGRVWAESPGPDEGSRFIIALPLATGSTSPLKPA